MSAIDEKMQSWIDVPAILEVKSLNEKVNGQVQYGVRIPMKPAQTPLVNCKLSSTDRIYGEKPGYWFINNDLAIKVKLYTKKVNNEKGTITGIGRDTSFFRYLIRRK